MLKLNCIAGMFSVGLMVVVSGGVSAQNYPNKVIRIVTGEAGGSSDIAARLIAQEISKGLGQNVVVENRPTSVVGEVVAKAPPDGYTLLLVGSAFVIGPLLQKTPYDPVGDFSPITIAMTLPNLLVVHPSLPVNSVKELVALAKARPGALNYGSGPLGSPPHLAAELFKSMAGVNIVRINYKGGAAAVNDLIAGQVQFMFGAAGTVTQHVKSSRLKALAVTSAGPSALFPSLPTVGAAVPGYGMDSTYGIYAPAKTPLAIINRLNQEIVRVFNRAEVKEKLLSVGIEVVGSSPEQLAATDKSEIAKWEKVIKGAGIKVE